MALKKTISSLILLTLIFTAACAPAGSAAREKQMKVIAVESFLADIAQNIAGDRLQVETLMSPGLDPHSYEPSPRDLARVNDSDLLILNGAGFEAWFENILETLPPTLMVVEASHGLPGRTAPEAVEEDDHHEGQEGHGHDHEIDPHFWLNPLLVIKYVENIRDAFIQLDPQGAADYQANADIYIQKLKDLDQEIQEKFEKIPAKKKVIISNHESFGYFADQYGFTIAGTILHSVSTASSPSAQQMVYLIEKIKSENVQAILLELGANTQLAQQLHEETGVKVVTDLYTHSISPADGPAPSYIDLMRYNVDQIVMALGN